MVRSSGLGDRDAVDGVRAVAHRRRRRFLVDEPRPAPVDPHPSARTDSLEWPRVLADGHGRRKNVPVTSSTGWAGPTAFAGTPSTTSPPVVRQEPAPRDRRVLAEPDALRRWDIWKFASGSAWAPPSSRTSDRLERLARACRRSRAGRRGCWPAPARPRSEMVRLDVGWMWREDSISNSRAGPNRRATTEDPMMRLSLPCAVVVLAQVLTFPRRRSTTTTRRLHRLPHVRMEGHAGPVARPVRHTAVVTAIEPSWRRRGW